MQPLSLRLRLVFVTVAVSGAVLLTFGGVAWWSLYQSRVRALDAELATLGLRMASRSGPNVDFSRQESLLADTFGQQKAANRFFAFVYAGGDTFFKSNRWPETLNPEAYEGGQDYSKEQPPEPIRKQERPNEAGRGRERLRLVFEPRYYTVDSGDHRYRLGVFANDNMRIVLGADLDEFAKDINQVSRAFLVAVPGALLLLAAGAWYLSHRTLRPIEALSQDMESVSAQGLDQRLRVEPLVPELSRIVRAYNGMLERLERSFHQAVRFSANASHELKTPLTIIQGTLERALETSGAESPDSHTYAELLDQVARLRSVLESLLLLSRVDAGKLALSRETVSLSHLCEVWLEDAGLLAEDRGIEIVSEVEPGIEIQADPSLLQVVAHNLLTNALIYNREGGRVECRLSRSSPDTVLWEIANTGEPVPPELRDRVFDRFYRVPRQGQAEGSGLGLSLVREIVKAHEGDIRLTVGEDGLNRFEVRLPATGKESE